MKYPTADGRNLDAEIDNYKNLQAQLLVKQQELADATQAVEDVETAMFVSFDRDDRVAMNALQMALLADNPKLKLERFQFHKAPKNGPEAEKAVGGQNTSPTVQVDLTPQMVGRMDLDTVKALRLALFGDKIFP